jgi:hypothetical protein
VERSARDEVAEAIVATGTVDEHLFALSRPSMRQRGAAALVGVQN